MMDQELKGELPTPRSSFSIFDPKILPVTPKTKNTQKNRLQIIKNDFVLVGKL